MREQLNNLYHNQGLSLEDIGAIYGVSRVTVSNWLKKHNIPRRTRSEARLLALQKGKFEGKKYHDFNRQFFDEWSPSMAYLLGLVFADGHISHRHLNGSSNHNLQFRFNASSELPEIIRGLMASKNSPYKIMSNDRPQLCLNFSSQRLIHHLIDLGVPSGKKSHKMLYPEMPPQYNRHFIRGFFDGDGGIYYTGRKRKAGWRPAQARFYSSSQSFLNGIAHHLSICGLTGHLYEEGRRLHELPQGGTDYIEGAYRLVYRRRSDCIELFSYLYDDVPDGQFMPRKKEKFRAILDQWPRHDHAA